jgi:hypothetical protein
MLAVAELFYGFTKFNPFVPPSYVFPQNDVFTFLESHAGINRFWGYGTAHVDANYAAQYRLYSADGTDPLNLRWYNAFVQSSGEGHIPSTFTRSTRSDAYIKQGYGVDDFPNNPYRTKILNTLGVKYILDRTDNPKGNDTFPPSVYSTVYQKDDWIIYENKAVAPRYFLTSDVTYYKTNKEFERLFFSPTFDPKAQVLIESDSTPLTLAPTTNKKVTLTSYSPNTIEFKTTSDAPQLLFLSDTYDVGWLSFIDNNPTKTIKANYALRAVYVPKGDHTITMSYIPTSFIRGRQLSLVGVALLVLYVATSIKRTKKKS